jgi:hypothetical protein
VRPGVTPAILQLGLPPALSIGGTMLYRLYHMPMRTISNQWFEPARLKAESDKLPRCGA